MQKENGIFTISLDFELHWGIFDVVPIENKLTYFENTLDVIPRILDLFLEYGVECTWAIVGMLFNKDFDELINTKPKSLPGYLNSKLSAYKFVDEEYRDSHAKYYFAPRLVKLINETKGQEVATHTYSHYYTLAKGQTQEEFAADLEASVDKAKNIDIEMKSIVFPRNQYNKNYNDVCLNYGISIFRTNPKSWFWKSNENDTDSIIKKVARTLDCYLPISKTTYSLEGLKIEKREPLLLPASRFYKPIEKNRVPRRLKQLRIKNEMMRAAKSGECYHLWWHPHNFGTHPEDSLTDLKEILEYYQELKNRYNLDSLNMGNIHNKIVNSQAS